MINSMPAILSACLPAYLWFKAPSTLATCFLLLKAPLNWIPSRPGTGSHRMPPMATPACSSCSPWRHQQHGRCMAAAHAQAQGVAWPLRKHRVWQAT